MTTTARLLLGAFLLAAPLAAQDADHARTAVGGVGMVHFPTSCNPAVAPRFDRAVALLHSFEFRAATEAFQGVLAADSSCAMAQWGVALSRWSNPMSAGNRTLTVLAGGRQAADAALRLAPGATPRERDWIAAVGKLYTDYEHLDQRTRAGAYEQAMAALASQYPDDTEAQIFHAISLVAVAPPTDKSYANQRLAGAILERLWAAQPNHPGLAHYIIHSYDVPALAPLAAEAARRYATIAPDAAHALHMPSHTFTRLGQWSESVNANRRSAEAALRSGSFAEALHASDYMEYAYLQMRQETAARGVLEGLPPIAARFDPAAVTGAAPGSAGVFALAAIPARYALERRDWAQAAALTPRATPFAYADAMTWFARALGAAHLRRVGEARAAVDSLVALQARLVAQHEAYWAEQVAIQRLGAEAWLDHAQGRNAEALAQMSEAATREDATEKSAVTPGPLAPARELLGDLLMQLGRPREALAEYRRTLEREPRRYRALDGAARSAAAAGNAAGAARYRSELAALSRPHAEAAGAGHPH